MTPNPETNPYSPPKADTVERPVRRLRSSSILLGVMLVATGLFGLCVVGMALNQARNQPELSLSIAIPGFLVATTVAGLLYWGLSGAPTPPPATLDPEKDPDAHGPSGR